MVLIIFILSLLLSDFISAIPTVVRNPSDSISGQFEFNESNATFTSRKLPVLVKDDLIQVIHLYNTIVVHNQGPIKGNEFVIELCIKALGNLENKSNEIKNVTFQFLEEKSRENLDNITNMVDYIQTQAINSIEQNESFKNTTLKEMNHTMTLLIHLNVTTAQFVSEHNNTSSYAKLGCLHFLLEARILALIETYEIYIKLKKPNEFKQFEPLVITEQKLLEVHWEAIKRDLIYKLSTYQSIFRSKENITDKYEQIIGIERGVLINTKQLNKTCEKTCPLPENLSKTIFNPPNFMYCTGDIYGCMAAEDSYEICVSADDVTKYKFIKGQSETYGKVVNLNSCNNFGLTKVKSDGCKLCFCKCDDDKSNTLRHFILDAVESDISQNKVITGVTFSKYNTFYIGLQIIEGTMKQYGHVDVDPFWKEKEPIEKFFTLGAEHRRVTLNDIFAPPGHVITGIRFAKDPIRIEIRVNKYDFYTGQIDKKNNSWKKNDGFYYDELKLDNSLVPTELQNDQLTVNKIIAFQSTGWQADLASSIIPFIQVAVMNRTSLLSGVGLAHWGNMNKSSGGFLTLTAHSYGFQHIWDFVTIELDNKQLGDIDNGLNPEYIIYGASGTGILLLFLTSMFVVRAFRKKQKDVLPKPDKSACPSDSDSEVVKESESNDESSDEEGSSDEDEEDSEEDSDSSNE